MLETEVGGSFDALISTLRVMKRVEAKRASGAAGADRKEGGKDAEDDVEVRWSFMEGELEETEEEEGGAVKRVRYVRDIHGLPARQRAAVCRQLFEMFDRDKNGTLDVQEFRDCMKAMGLELDGHEVELVFQSFSCPLMRVDLETFQEIVECEEMRSHAPAGESKHAATCLLLIQAPVPMLPTEKPRGSQSGVDRWERRCIARWGTPVPPPESSGVAFGNDARGSRGVPLMITRACLLAHAPCPSIFAVSEEPSISTPRQATALHLPTSQRTSPGSLPRKPTTCPTSWTRPTTCPTSWSEALRATPSPHPPLFPGFWRRNRSARSKRSTYPPESTWLRQRTLFRCMFLTFFFSCGEMRSALHSSQRPGL